MRLNVEKSKVVVFRKGNRLPGHRWTFGDIDLQVSNTISYLGVLFTSNGLFTQAQFKLAEQARKATFILQKRLNHFKSIKPSVVLDLFDKYIGPILNYSCEVWGFHTARDIEKVHLNYCKRLLGVKRTTQNDFTYGELGRFPMQTIRYVRIIAYWLKIITGSKSLYINVIYQNALHEIDYSNKVTWCRSIRNLLFECGFGYVWLNQGVGNIKCFLSFFKQRLFDMYKQGWRSRLTESTI